MALFCMTIKIEEFGSRAAQNLVLLIRFVFGQQGDQIGRFFAH
jgi:hypothetical protein